MMAFLESGEGVVIMTNADLGTSLAEEIMRGLGQEYEWPGFEPEERVVADLDPTSFVSYIGQYKFDIVPDIFAMVTIEEGKLFMEIIQPIARNKAEILPEGEHRFFSRESGSRVTFLPDENMQVKALALHQSDGEFVARKTNIEIGR
jgi:hypothetical protein